MRSCVLQWRERRALARCERWRLIAPSSNIMRGSLRAAVSGVLAGLLSMVPAPCHGAALLLHWTSVQSVTGYRLYVGDQSGVYKHPRDVSALAGQPPGGVFYFLARGFQPGRRYYGAVTAYNTVGESNFSNEKAFVIQRSGRPRAKGGPNQRGSVGEVLFLGTPPDPGVNYVWLQRRGPAATLGNPTKSRTSIVASAPGIYTFVLVAYDASGAASTDIVRVVIAAANPRHGEAAAASTALDATNIAPLRPPNTTLSDERGETPTASATPSPSPTPTDPSPPPPAQP
jgi:K319-like protein